MLLQERAGRLCWLPSARIWGWPGPGALWMQPCIWAWRPCRPTLPHGPCCPLCDPVAPGLAGGTAGQALWKAAVEAWEGRPWPSCLCHLPFLFHLDARQPHTQQGNSPAGVLAPVLSVDTHAQHCWGRGMSAVTPDPLALQIVESHLDLNGPVPSTHLHTHAHLCTQT